METKFTNVGERITMMLNKRELSQAELARRTALSKTAITNYVKGDRQPDTLATYKIAQVLNTSMEWLLTGLDMMELASIWELTPAQKEAVHAYFPELTEEQAALLNNFEKLSSRDKREIRGIIEMKLEGNGDGSFNSMTSKSDESGPTKTA